MSSMHKPSYYNVPGTNRYELYIELNEIEFNKLFESSQEVGVDVENLAHYFLVQTLSK